MVDEHDDEVEDMESEPVPSTPEDSESASKKRKLGIDDMERGGGHKVNVVWEEGKVVIPGDRCLVSELTATYIGGGSPVLQVRVHNTNVSPCCIEIRQM